ncbi:hypothetical protein ACLB2K_059111 [Fragaria x ananassa]
MDTMISLNRSRFLGLIVSSRLESLQHFKKPWAHEHEPVTTLVDAVNSNNAYIFPGFGLGLLMSGTIRVHDDMLLAACLATRLPQPKDLFHYAESCMYSPNYRSFK